MLTDALSDLADTAGNSGESICPNLDVGSFPSTASALDRLSPALAWAQRESIGTNRATPSNRAPNEARNRRHGWSRSLSTWGIRQKLLNSSHVLDAHRRVFSKQDCTCKGLLARACPRIPEAGVGGPDLISAPFSDATVGGDRRLSSSARLDGGNQRSAVSAAESRPTLWPEASRSLALAHS